MAIYEKYIGRDRDSFKDLDDLQTNYNPKKGWLKCKNLSQLFFLFKVAELASPPFFSLFAEIGLCEEFNGCAARSVGSPADRLLDARQPL